VELKPGYKQTEIGVIPQDWDAARLGEIATIERGKFSARPRNDPAYYGGDYPFIQTGDVARSGGTITSFAQTLNEAGLRVSRLFPTETLFFTIAANIGDVGIAYFEAACPDSLVAVVPGEGANKKWLLYELASRKQEFEALASPGAQLNINLEKLRPKLLAVPTLPEQRAIATSIADTDALVGELERVIAKKRDLKQAVMQELLTGKTRLPGFHGEWEVKRLGDLGMTYGGLTGKRKDDFESGSSHFITFMQVMSNVTIGSGGFGRVHVQTGESQNLVRRGDLLFNGSSETPEDLALCALLTVDAAELFLNSFCFGFRLHSDCSADGLFLAYLFRSDVGRAIMSTLAQGSTRYNLSKAALLGVPLCVPALEEQIQISAVLSDMDAELAALEARRDKTRALKEAMMQELLTGRTRLV
jgi:type I restriction enzyme, S subunit